MNSRTQSCQAPDVLSAAAQSRMRNVLIISPRFPPSNAPDAQRVRLALPFLEARGWRPTVICVDADFVAAPRDPLLASTIPAEVTVHRVSAWSRKWTRLLGIGSLSMRSGRQISSVAKRLLREQKFDLVFFSTTEFGLLPLGPAWLRKFGVPYVVDLQDPWVNHYYRDNQLRPPGGQFKHFLHQWAASRFEPRVLGRAAMIMVVSGQYSETLGRRYPFLSDDRFVTIPFAATLKDVEVASSSQVTNSCYRKDDGRKHWVYVGRCGPDMRHSLTSILVGFRKFLELQPTAAKKIQLDFIGTDYAPPGSERYWVRPIADDLGIGEFVRETPRRVPYFEALRCLVDADALVIPGSGDASYTASKIYPYITAARPLLTVFHQDSSVNDVMRRVRAGTCVTFSSADDPQQTAAVIYERWFEGRRFETPPATDWEAFSSCLAPTMTDRIVECFEAALSQPQR